ncbi:hypothetical protein DRQ53_12680, partial [bacterium]
MRHKRLNLVAVLLGAFVLLLVHACSEDVIAPTNNEPPHTEVRATAPRSAGATFMVDFFFSGTDPDGQVEFFEWRVLESHSDDPLWTRTEASDLTLSFPDGSNEPGFETPGPDRTFQVRAVDESGLVDPTPASVSFTPLTLVPEIVLSLGRPHPISCMQSSPAMTFQWTATDTDSKSGRPEFVRYILKKYGNPADPCLLRFEFEGGDFPILRDDPAWSDWIRYDAGLDSGRVVRYPTLPASDLGTSYVFAVQARDIDGAVSRGFYWGQQVAHVRVTDTGSPLLTVNEPTLGVQVFQKLAGVKTYEINAGQNLEFSWIAEQNYFSEIAGFRYGWDLLDPNDPDDPGWSVNWGDWANAPTRSLDTGAHNFVVQVRDRANVVTRATYILNVGAAAGIPEINFRLFMDVGTGIEPDWELRWTGNSQGPDAASPEETPFPFAGFQGRFKIEWEAISPNGPIIGYRYRTEQGSDTFWPPDSGGEKQWDMEATSFVFDNEIPPSPGLGAGCGPDAVGCDPALVRFPSGNYDLSVQALDAALVESEARAGDLEFTVNYTPETQIVVDATYPRFEVRDQSGILLRSGSIAIGDTIPAMSTAFFRSRGYDKFSGELPPGVPSDSLCCDTPLNYDPSLPPDDPDYVPLVEYQSRLVTVRRVGDEPVGRHLSNTFSATEEGDTISFWVGPLDYDYQSRTVDEHRRPDVDPDTYELVGGFRPRVRADLSIPGRDIPGEPGDVADTLLVNFFGAPFPENEVPFRVDLGVNMWFIPDPTAECGGVLIPAVAGEQAPDDAETVPGVRVSVRFKFVGEQDARDPLSPVKAWTFALFSDKDPDNEIEDGRESRDLSFFSDSPLPNEWEFGITDEIEFWAPIALNDTDYNPDSTDDNRRAVGCLVAQRLGDMTLRVRGR